MAALLRRLLERPPGWARRVAPRRGRGRRPKTRRREVMTMKLEPWRIPRRFNAAPERVFDAWLDPMRARRWLFTSPTSERNITELDVRVGGKWSITDRRDGVDYTGLGEYIE